MPSLAHEQVATERHQVGAEVDEQHASEADVVIDEAHERAGHEPPTLNSCHQKAIGVDELRLGRQLLYERGDRGPEDPEAERNQDVHQVELPYVHAMQECQDSNAKNDDPAHRIEHHHEAAPISAIDEDAGEGQQQHRRQGLQDHQPAERDFAVRRLQYVPGDRGAVHSAAKHGDDVGGEHEAKSAMAKDVPHMA